MANDYWAYLRDENELKHYRTPGALNKNPIKGTRLPDGTIVYDDKVAAAQARGQARQQQASRAAKERLIDRGASGGNENRYSGGSGNNDGSYGRTRDLVAEAQARGQARQQQASRAAKERLIERGNNGGNANRRVIPLLKSDGNVVNYDLHQKEQAAKYLKNKQLAWRESQTVKGKIKNVAAEVSDTVDNLKERARAKMHPVDEDIRYYTEEAGRKAKEFGKNVASVSSQVKDKVASKTLGAIDSIKKKLAKKR